jgi:NAD(P)-dependent dehydrogenase (short-subunit alcohol dehydrogenase family)
MLSDVSSKYGPDRLLVLKLDVGAKAEVAAAFARARVAFGRIDVVYSNAGYTTVNEVEDTTDEIARPMFDTNFWGAVYVAQEAVRFFRDVNPVQGGRLIQVSSFFGHASSPSVAFYCARCFLSIAQFVSADVYVQQSG